MSFSFQINEDIKFKRNTQFLEEAEKNKPELIYKKIIPKRLIEIVKNEKSFTSKKSSLDLEKLSQNEMKKRDKIIIDLGNHYVGKFSVTIQAKGSPMDAPFHFRIKFAEVISELTADASEYDGWISSSWIFQEYFHIDVLPTTLCLSRRYSCRYIEIEVLDTSPKYKVTFENPIFTMESSVDMSEVGHLNLEDALLNRIDQISLKTLQDCMQTVFEDGPKRDQRLWLGDLRLQAQANMLTFKNKEIVRRCLYLFGAMPTTTGKIPANVFIKPDYIPDDTFLFDYSLFFVNTLLDYYQFSLETKIVNDLYPVAKQAIELALENVSSEGEITFDESWPFFVDWSDDINKETAGYGILIFSLNAMKELAILQADKNYVSVINDKISLLKTYVFDNFYNQELKIFTSGEKKELNIASQVWMVFSGVLSREESNEVMKISIDKLYPITGIATPYMYHHIAEALFIAGLKNEAIDLIKNYWGKMVELGADTFWEAFKPEEVDFSPYGNSLVNSYCHAWSCTPCYLFRKYL